MGSKKNRNADQSAMDQNSADQNSADQAVSSDAPPAEAAATVNTITMEDFITRADRADWLSVADAAKYLTDVRGATDIDAQKMRNAANNRAEFSADGARLKVVIPGYEIKPLTYLHHSAVDLYHDNNISGNTRSARTLANGKRWIIRVKADDHAAVTSALAAYGITLEAASAAHKKAEADADEPNSETITANAEQSADASNGTHDADASADGNQPVDMQRTEEMTFA